MKFIKAADFHTQKPHKHSNNYFSFEYAQNFSCVFQRNLLQNHKLSFVGRDPQGSLKSNSHPCTRPTQESQNPTKIKPSQLGKIHVLSIKMNYLHVEMVLEVRTLVGHNMFDMFRHVHLKRPISNN